MILFRLIAIYLISSFLLVANEGESGQWKTLREKVSKLVDIQSEESNERNDWIASKGIMKAQLELYSKEIMMLSEEIEKSGKSSLPHAETIDTLKSQIQALRETNRTMAEILARRISQALRVSRAFPQPLHEECKEELDRLKSMEKDLKIREGFESLISILSKADQFNRRITQTKEIRGEQEYQVLYLGLARAFYMDSKNGAGIGVPGAEAWEWIERKDIRKDLEVVHKILDQAVSPAWVNLPLEIR